MKKKVKWIISIIVVALVGLLIFDKVTKNTSEAKPDSSEKNYRCCGNKRLAKTVYL